MNESENIYYNISIYNDTNKPVPMEKETQFNQSLIVNPSDYTVTINKLRMPANLVKTFIIEDKSKYNLKYSVNVSNHSKTNEIQKFTAENYLYNDKEYEMYSSEDMLENFNKTSIRTYRDLLNSLDGYCNTKESVSGSIDTSISSTSPKYEETISMPTQSGMTRKLGYTRLKLNIEEDNTNPDIYEVVLKSPETTEYPDGIECLVYSGYKTDFSNQLVFEEASLNHISKTSHDNVLSGDYVPQESFVKFNNNDIMTGDWKLIIRNKNQNSSGFSIKIDYELDCFFIPHVYNDLGLPNRAPFVYINDTNNKMVMNIHENTIRSGMNIIFSPALHGIFDFRANKTSDNQRQLVIPQTTLSSGYVSSLEIEQPISSVYRLNDISQILLSSRLPIQGEYFDTAGVQNTVLMSLDWVPGEKNLVIYQSTNEDIRSYKLLSSNPLTEMNVKFFVSYMNSDRNYPIYIHPYDKATLQIKFSK